ncbi:MAG: hypothetical protein JEZ08_25150 [Clostridiales bacterium]|nr:hypothetical protein [Clostridiales bacterium]
MKSNLGKTALLAASLLYFGSCVTTGADVSAEQQPTPVVQSQSVENLVSEKSPQVLPYSQDLIQYLYPGLETNLTLDIPDQFQDENGLFLLKLPNSEYFNETWNRGYAGMFTDEDKAGRSIKGYDITLPMQIMGNWSAEPDDYFDRSENPYTGELNSEATLYYDDIDTYMFYNQLPFSEKTPYFELDKAYADMIKADDNLTPEEQLELIIMNHKGYIDPLFDNISDILEEHYVSDEFSLSGSANFVFNDTMHDEFRIGYKNGLDNSMDVNDFILKSLASLKIAEYRLPEFYQHMISDDYIEEIRLSKSQGNYSAVNRIYGNHNAIEMYSKSISGPFSATITTIIHESIHGILRINNLSEFGISLESSSWLNTPISNSEIMTYGHEHFTKELLNVGVLNLKGGYGAGSWYSIYGSSFNDQPSLEHFSAIITNQN